MSDTFNVEIISPDKSILKSKATEVVIPSYEGEIGILRDHINLITFLRPGLIKVFSSNDLNYYVEDGTIEFSNNNLLILTSTAKKVTDLSKSQINEDIVNAEKKMSDSKTTDKDKYLLSYKINTLKEIN